MGTISGSVERIVYHNPHSAFTVARLAPADRPKHSRRLTTVVGEMPGLKPGEVVKLEGEWYEHPKHGPTFMAKRFEVTLPAEEQAIGKYLASGWIRGIGQAKAALIARHFGNETFRILSQEPERLTEVNGIGRQALAIAEAWHEQAATRHIAEFLLQSDLDVSLAPVIFNVYGAQAVDYIRQNPYRLSHDFDEIGFEAVERLAKQIGYPRQGPERLASAVRHVLKLLSEEGHVFVPQDTLVAKVAAKLKVEIGPVVEALNLLRATRQAVVETVEPFCRITPAATEQGTPMAGPSGPPSNYQGRHPEPQRVILGDSEGSPFAEQSRSTPSLDTSVPRHDEKNASDPSLSDSGDESFRPQVASLDKPNRVYLASHFLLETGLARRIATVQERLDDDPIAADWEQFFAAYEWTEGIALDPQQRKAVKRAAESKTCVITGGPGVGKTMILRVLANALQQNGKTFCLTAPTGRAAKRLSEVTGEPAQTIHRLLGYQPGIGRFRFDGEIQLPFQYVIVDEASMLELSLAHHLLKAVPAEAHLVLVGDADQLPSIGPGNVLSDVIASGGMPVERLTRLFRQAHGGQLLYNAHRLNQGLPPVLDRRRDSDFFLVPAESAEEAASSIVSLVVDRLPRAYHLSDRAAIQVLSPIYSGVAGVTNLNQILQDRLNPRRLGTPELSVGNQVLRQGDKVMQIRNNYQKGVYNGDIGQVEYIDRQRHRLVVNYGEIGENGGASSSLRVTYDRADSEEIVLAYASSVHKSQGCEYPVVVMPVIPEHLHFLQRSLLYTAITRAKRLCVLVGSAEVLAVATARNLATTRCTALSERLRSFIQKGSRGDAESRRETTNE